MKKFSTAACILAFTSVFAPLTSLAQTQTTATPRCEFLPNAPDQHMVVRGDTLWDISGKFLQHPWCWPQVWGLNQDQIRDPHWIYPGQIVYFDRVAGRLRLGIPTGAMEVTSPDSSVRLSPQMRSKDLGND